VSGRYGVALPGTSPSHGASWWLRGRWQRRRGRAGALQSQVRELQRLLGKKAMEAEILKEERRIGPTAFEP